MSEQEARLVVSGPDVIESEPQTQHRPREEFDAASVIRGAIALLGVVVAIAVWFLAGPHSTDPELLEATTHRSDVRDALDRQDANEILADSAPQQTVVNTWATVDFLEIVATQLDDAAELIEHTTAAQRDDQRVPALLLVITIFGGASLAAEPTVRLLSRTR